MRRILLEGNISAPEQNLPNSEAWRLNHPVRELPSYKVFIFPFLNFVPKCTPVPTALTKNTVTQEAAWCHHLKHLILLVVFCI